MKPFSFISLALIAPVAASIVNCSTTTFQAFLDANGTNAQVVYAHHYEQNSTFVNPNETSATIPTELPAACAVQVNATTDVGTHYSFGVFLPDEWNGRFL